MSKRQRPDPKPRPGNYVAKVSRLQAEDPVPPGQVREILIYHDDDCGIHDGARCDCDPDVRYRIDPRQN